MHNPKGMFKRAWITAGHGELWNCRATYCTVPHENLPQVTRATDDLKWLDCISPELRQVVDGISTLNNSDNEIENLDSLAASAQTLGLQLPQAFLTFMRDTSLQDKVPTCTDCHLALSEDFLPVPGVEGIFLLRFLNDSQSCVMWYLCLGRERDVGVVASDYYLEPEIFDVMEYEGVQREDLFSEAVLCADTFTEFLYRFWVENSIWYSLQAKLPLTPLLEEYRNQITKKLA